MTITSPARTAMPARLELLTLLPVPHRCTAACPVHLRSGSGATLAATGVPAAKVGQLLTAAKVGQLLTLKVGTPACGVGLRTVVMFVCARGGSTVNVPSSYGGLRSWWHCTS